MQTEEFVARVAAAAPGRDPERAFEMTVPTLEVFCAHLPAEEARRLAAQLPQALADVAEAGGSRSDTSARAIDLNEFYAKVAERAEVSGEEATEYADAVIRVLKDAVSDGEIADVALELPPELSSLLER